MPLELFAEIQVADLAAAEPHYRALFGEPSFRPHATEVVWTLAEHRHVAVDQQPGLAGRSHVTVFVDDLDAALATIRARGLEPDDTEVYSNGVRKALFRDADGNEVGFGGAP